MPSIPELSHLEDGQQEPQPEEAVQEPDLAQVGSPKQQPENGPAQETPEEVIATDSARSSPRRKYRSCAAYLVEEEEIVTVRRKTSKVNWGPVHVVALDSEEAHVRSKLQHDSLAGNLICAVHKSPPRFPPAPPPMNACPSPPRCEQHVHAQINAARRKARFRTC